MEIFILGVGATLMVTYNVIASRITLRKAEQASQEKINARRAELGRLN